jgi:hypothetical protein
VTGQQHYEGFWEALALRLLHPTQLLILEALSRIGQPLSPTLLEHVSGKRISLGVFDYHCKRLTSLGVLKIVKRKRRRGASEKFYDLVKLEG